MNIKDVLNGYLQFSLVNHKIFDMFGYVRASGNGVSWHRVCSQAGASTSNPPNQYQKRALSMYIIGVLPDVFFSMTGTVWSNTILSF